MMEKSKLTRREFVKRTAVAGAGLALLSKYAVPSAQAAYANSKGLNKWNPGGVTWEMRRFGKDIPVVTGTPDPVFPNTDLYEVTAAEFTDILHPELGGPTTLWGYHATNGGVSRHLGGAIVATRGRASRIRMTNSLPRPLTAPTTGAQGTQIVPIDITLPGAALQSPDRIAVHLHGGLVPWISDGGPFDSWDSLGNGDLSFLNGPLSNIFNTIPGKPMQPGQADYFYPNNQSTRMLWYHDHAHGTTRLNAYAGLATGYIILDPTIDAALGTKLPPLQDANKNWQTIPLVFQDKMFVWGAPAAGATPATGTFLIDPTWPTVMPAKSQAPGSLWYAHVYDPKLYRLNKGGRTTLAPPDPSCVPEFFGDTMLANGLAYPTCTLEAKRYRFMVLNACNARFLNINLFEILAGTSEVPTNPKTLFATWLPLGGVASAITAVQGPPIIQIGNEAGYLVKEAIHVNGVPANPATFTGNMLLAPAERADIIIDFTGMAGKEFMFYNDAPGPFPGGAPTNDYWRGNPANPVQPLPGQSPDTRNILKFKIVASTTTATDLPQALPIFNSQAQIDPPLSIQWTAPAAGALNVPPITVAAATAALAALPVPAVPTLRNITLNEDFDVYGRLLQRLGDLTPAMTKIGNGFGLDYMAAATEIPTAGTYEIWQCFNTTADSHPIHIHLINAQILSRQPFKIVNGVFTATGLARGPEFEEYGWKETIKMNPGECTTLLMKFDMDPVPFNVPPSPRTGGNEYVYHCHILEHEEHDMMRPLVVMGQNPQSALVVTPTAASVAAATGGTANFTIIGPSQAGCNIVSSDPVNFPVTPTVNAKGITTGFSVTVATGLTAPMSATIAVTDVATPTLVASAAVSLV